MDKDGLFESVLSAFDAPIFVGDIVDGSDLSFDSDQSGQTSYVTSSCEAPNDKDNHSESRTNVSGILPGDYQRIKNAANRTGLVIYVVGSRANGKATLTSDWDYVIPDLNCKKWKKIKNSLPGAKTIDRPRKIDIMHSPLNEELPYIMITPD